MRPKSAESINYKVKSDNRWSESGGIQNKFDSFLPPTFRIEFIKNRQIITFIADSLYYRTFPTAAYAEPA